MNNLESLLIFLFIGLIAGWLAGIVVKGRGFGLFGDILIGVIGAELGGWIFGRLGFSAYGFTGAVLMAFVGAVALLAVIKLVVRAGSARTIPAVLFFLTFGWTAYADTTVIVENDDKVTVTQPNGYAPANETPVVITREAMTEDFEGQIVEIDFSRSQMRVRDAEGRDREVLVTPETINSYRIGDTVLVHPTAAVTLVTVRENPKDFEGEIIRVEMSKNQIVVQDTSGRERRVQLKQGMIGTYKVDDYVRIHLMADLKEAKTIETVRGVKTLEGGIVSVDTLRSRIVVRDNDGRESAVLLRQGLIHSYRVGDRVQISLLPNREQVQVIRAIR